MSFSRNVRISKLQSKNHMVGESFNPSGYTLSDLDKRDNDFLESFRKSSFKEKQETIKGLKETVALCNKKGWSYPFEYNLLKLNGLLDLKELKGGIRK